MTGGNARYHQGDNVCQLLVNIPLSEEIRTLGPDTASDFILIANAVDPLPIAAYHSTLSTCCIPSRIVLGKTLFAIVHPYI